ncbi:hypothetical protein A0H81_00496 [Grifola frondosa]|uniref:Uncharacterized protein n=1 Tax=Grifola frondosa TaxID=5627 RepID=A0A1C7MQ86_GRIFR|nr:hypothetical protein A0H81_00496 [Grifola frondosa]
MAGPEPLLWTNEVSPSNQALLVKTFLDLHRPRLPNLNKEDLTWELSWGNKHCHILSCPTSINLVHSMTVRFVLSHKNTTHPCQTHRIDIANE